MSTRKDSSEVKQSSKYEVYLPALPDSVTGVNGYSLYVSPFISKPSGKKQSDKENFSPLLNLFPPLVFKAMSVILVTSLFLTPLTPGVLLADNQTDEVNETGEVEEDESAEEVYVKNEDVDVEEDEKEPSDDKEDDNDKKEAQEKGSEDEGQDFSEGENLPEENDLEEKDSESKAETDQEEEEVEKKVENEGLNEESFDTKIKEEEEDGAGEEEPGDLEGEEKKESEVVEEEGGTEEGDRVEPKEDGDEEGAEEEEDNSNEENEEENQNEENENNEGNDNNEGNKNNEGGQNGEHADSPNNDDLVDELEDKIRQELLKEFNNSLEGFNLEGFDKEHCSFLSENEFYCVNNIDVRDRSENYTDIISFKDQNNISQIVYRNGPNRIRELTANQYEDKNPAYNHDKSFAAWMRLVNERWQIVVFDLNSGEEVFITDSQFNNTNPVLSSSGVVWQGWEDNGWEVFHLSLKNKEVRRLSNDGYHNINPQIFGDTVFWSSFRDGSWSMISYNLLTGKETVVRKNQRGSNPKLLLVWEEGEDEKTLMQFDPFSDRVSKLGKPSEDQDKPEPIPNPFEEEERALIQTREDGSDDGELEEEGDDEGEGPEAEEEFSEEEEVDTESGEDGLEQDSVDEIDEINQ